jgi:hypothetical protein
MDWLQAHGPLEWHGLVTNWQAATGDFPVAWICNQPDCDVATAQVAFWRNNGAQHFKYGLITATIRDEDRDPGFKLARLIGHNWWAGLYQTAGIMLSRAEWTEITEGRAEYDRHTANQDLNAFPFHAPSVVPPEQGSAIPDIDYFMQGGFPLDLWCKWNPQLADQAKAEYQRRRALRQQAMSQPRPAAPRGAPTGGAPGRQRVA